jgi:DNA-binding NtrC family response regulator
MARDAQPTTLAQARDAADKQAVLAALRKHEGRRDLAAGELQISERYLYSLIRRHKLDRDLRAIEREAGRKTWAPGRPAA